MPHRTVRKYAPPKNPSPQESHEAFQRKERMDEFMDDAIIAGIRENKDALIKADEAYFALSGRHICQDIRKYLTRLEHNAQSYIVSQHIRQQRQHIKKQ